MKAMERDAILKQIDEKRRINERNAREEYERDKRNVDEIMRKIMEEETAALQEKKRKQEETRAIIAEYERRAQEAKHLSGRKISTWRRT